MADKVPRGETRIFRKVLAKIVDRASSLKVGLKIVKSNSASFMKAVGLTTVILRIFQIFVRFNFRLSVMLRSCVPIVERVAALRALEAESNVAGRKCRLAAFGAVIGRQSRYSGKRLAIAVCLHCPNERSRLPCV